MGKNNRRKGHTFERTICQKLKSVFPEAMTSRAGDRSKDSQGVDILNTKPFNIQAKSKINFPNPATIFKEMPKDSNYNVLAVKLKSKGNYIVMEMDDFLEVLIVLKTNGVI